MTGAGSQLSYRGALALPNDAGPSLVVDLRVDNDVVVITQDDEQIGVWDVGEVDAERLSGEQFRLMLGDDEVIFHARDRAGFAYTGLNALRAAKDRVEHERSRWWQSVGRTSGEDPSDAPAIVTKAISMLAGLGPSLRRNLEERRTAPGPAPSIVDLVPQSDAAVVELVRESHSPPTGGPARATVAKLPVAGNPQPAAVTEPTDDPPTTSAGEPAGDSEEASKVATPDKTKKKKKSGSRLPRGAHRQADPSSGASPDPWGLGTEELLSRDDAAAEAAAPARPSRSKRRGKTHDHAFDETRLPGGLVRSVCDCGEVVIRSED